LPFKDEDAWRVFLGEHEAWHRTLAQLVKAQTGTDTPVGLLDDLRDNRALHQRMHHALADALGVPRSVEMTGYDLEREDAFVTFMHIHSLDHQRFRLVLGV
jgi:hypothetical protein